MPARALFRRTAEGFVAHKASSEGGWVWCEASRNVNGEGEYVPNASATKHAIDLRHRRVAALAGARRAVHRAVQWAGLVAIMAVANPNRATAQPVVASKTFTESVLLGELGRLLLRDCDEKPVHRQELGGSRVLFAALIRGDVDAYPEYTGTLEHTLAARVDLKHVGGIDAWLAAQGLARSRSLGFANGYTLALRREVANNRGISTLSDLKQHPDLRFALSHEFRQRPDGYPGLAARYGLRPKRVETMLHAIAYRAVNSGKADILDAYQTDGELVIHDLATLSDPEGYFPDYSAIWLYRRELSPACTAALTRSEGTLSAALMRELNAEALGKRASIHALALRLLHAVEDASSLDAGSDPLPEGDESEHATPPPTVLEQEIAASEAKAPGLTARIAARSVEHLRLVGIALAAAIPIALPLGIAAARYRRMGQVVLALVSLLQTIPSLALLVLLVPLLGIGEGPAILALILYALLPMVKNTQTSLRDIDPRILDAARGLGLTPLAQLRLVELPLATPGILAGVRIATIVSIGTATLGALIGAGGYGQPILSGIRTAHTPTVLEGALPAAALALLAQVLLESLERWLIPRGLRLARGRKR